ncbi:hypothetical protein R1sor_018215 [Riccia sorocarpa]|uniref:Reverse transcriptase domain-containing protein n=1 Tax=Riccia sorocarpa TaxID=122646 RepID=A0ABD3I922_9MARC
MATRFKSVLPALVDDVQNGFIQGRRITDNILMFKLGQEWSLKSKQPSMFIKLDFEKAFDRIDHQYIFDVMQEMGFDSRVLTLIRGFLQGATAKIHSMGWFSKEFPIERGVRQGCPLAPLLFSLVTQPLIQILIDFEKDGKLQGLKLQEGCTMLASMFADDTGVILRDSQENFDNLQQAIKVYEDISGSKLNIQKSLIIPWGRREAPVWMRNCQCKIARRGEVIRYLGYPVGWAITEEDQGDFIIAKIQSKLGSWSYRMLGFAGRLVVIKHILKAIPVHVLTVIPLGRNTLNRLEASCRAFLWGTSNGKKKAPLIAWTDCLKAKMQGGFGIPSFESINATLKLKMCLLAIGAGRDSKWAIAWEKLLKSVTGNSSKKNWTLQEILLADPPTKVGRASTAQALLKVWSAARNHLTLRRSEFCVNGWTPTEVYLCIGVWQRWFSKKIAGAGDALSIEIQDVNWRWSICNKEYTGWSLPTNVRNTLTAPRDYSISALNRKWNSSETTRGWGKRLTRIWKSPLSLADKSWCCKILQKGIPTMQRMLKLKKGDGKCIRCQRHEEDEFHLFWSCTTVRRKWGDFSYLVEGIGLQICGSGSFLQTFDKIFKGRDMAKIAAGVSMLKTIWRERNYITYGGVRKNFPLRSIFRQAVEVLMAYLSSRENSPRVGSRIREAIARLEVAYRRAETAEKRSFDLNARPLQTP